MIERKTMLEQAEPNCMTGLLGVKIAILLVEDGKFIDHRLHRTAIPADGDPAQHMISINAHFESMEPAVPSVSQADIDFVVACHELLAQRMVQK